MHDNLTTRLSRRDLLKGSGGLIAMTVLPTGLITGVNETWAASPKAVKPETFACLVQACRDIYPHDHLSDSVYAKVVEGFDAAAAEDAAEKDALESGVSALDQSAQAAHGVNYMLVGWEAQRVAILRDMQGEAFFQKLRGGLVTGIYNNTEVWRKFGYEGESASKGGYINRGFDDIDWLDQI